MFKRYLDYSKDRYDIRYVHILASPKGGIQPGNARTFCELFQLLVLVDPEHGDDGGHEDDGEVSGLRDAEHLHQHAVHQPDHGAHQERSEADTHRNQLLKMNTLNTISRYDIT